MSQPTNNIKKDLETISQALQVANAKGAFQLHESAAVYGALSRVALVIESTLANKEMEKVPKEMEKISMEKIANQESAISPKTKKSGSTRSKK